MMIEQHYDEEVLAEFLAEPADAVSRDTHLATCGLCKRTLDSLRSTARVLTEPAVWDKTPISAAPRPETLAFLRGMQKSMADEDAQAAVWIKQLLAGPRETWAARLEEHPEWRTGGMVRKLLEAGDAALATLPLNSLTLTELAAVIADGLVLKSAQFDGALEHLRGLAHYDKAYALWETGSIADAVRHLEIAKESFSKIGAAEFDSARADVVHSMALQVLERRDEALRLAQAAAVVFTRYDDADRVASARCAAAMTLQAAQRYREALVIHTALAEAEAISERRRITAVHNMSICYYELGEFEKAAASFGRAITGYERLEMWTFRAKSRWALGQLLVQQGHYDQALPIFWELRQEFEDLGMANDVAMVSLDLVEALLATGQDHKIADVCRSAISYFVVVGLSATEPALRALSYLQETAEAGQVTTKVIHDARAFLLPTFAPVRTFAELPQ